MMFYRHRASPKHRYDMNEVDYGGGGHRTQLRDPKGSIVVSPRGASLLVYTGVEEGEGAATLGVPHEE